MLGHTPAGQHPYALRPRPARVGGTARRPSCTVVGTVQALAATAPQQVWRAAPAHRRSQRSVRVDRSRCLAWRSGFEQPLARLKRSEMAARGQRPVFAAVVDLAFNGERLSPV
jgi:hypothetical protein